jgi:dihydroorotate dehydrogenase electron transfer subunit
MKKIYPLKQIIHLNHSYFILEIEAPEIAEITRPGQFCQLRPAEDTFPALRKPISIYKVTDGKIQFLIKNVGEGTNRLSRLMSGELLDVLGPLGNSFTIKNEQHVLLVSGGVGYPPLALLKTKLSAPHIHWLHGGRTGDDAFPADEIYTDDGSVGKKGLVIEGLKTYLEQHNVDIIYACGPKPMLAACVQIAKTKNIPIQVSLESYMACGIGVCYGCVVAMKSEANASLHYRRVCKDGPVFNGYEVNWDE